MYPDYVQKIIASIESNIRSNNSNDQKPTTSMLPPEEFSQVEISDYQNWCSRYIKAVGAVGMPPIEPNETDDVLFDTQAFAKYRKEMRQYESDTLDAIANVRKELEIVIDAYLVQKAEEEQQRLEEEARRRRYEEEQRVIAELRTRIESLAAQHANNSQKLATVTASLEREQDFIRSAQVQKDDPEVWDTIVTNEKLRNRFETALSTALAQEKKFALQKKELEDNIASLEKNLEKLYEETPEGRARREEEARIAYEREMKQRLDTMAAQADDIPFDELVDEGYITHAQLVPDSVPGLVNQIPNGEEIVKNALVSHYQEQITRYVSNLAVSDESEATQIQQQLVSAVRDSINVQYLELQARMTPSGSISRLEFEVSRAMQYQSAAGEVLESFDSFVPGLSTLDDDEILEYNDFGNLVSVGGQERARSLRELYQEKESSASRIRSERHARESRKPRANIFGVIAPQELEVFTADMQRYNEQIAELEEQIATLKKQESELGASYSVSPVFNKLDPDEAAVMEREFLASNGLTDRSFTKRDIVDRLREYVKTYTKAVPESAGGIVIAYQELMNKRISGAHAWRTGVAQAIARAMQ